jgi:hypothetical protein
MYLRNQYWTRPHIEVNIASLSPLNITKTMTILLHNRIGNRDSKGEDTKG